MISGAARKIGRLAQVSKVVLLKEQKKGTKANNYPVASVGSKDKRKQLAGRVYVRGKKGSGSWRESAETARIGEGSK